MSGRFIEERGAEAPPELLVGKFINKFIADWRCGPVELVDEMLVDLLRIVAAMRTAARRTTLEAAAASAAPCARPAETTPVEEDPVAVFDRWWRENRPSDERERVTVALQEQGLCGAIMGAKPDERACILPLGHGPHGGESHAELVALRKVADAARTLRDAFADYPDGPEPPAGLRFVSAALNELDRCSSPSEARGRRS